MNYRTIGNIEVSPIGMGCIGFSHGYGAVPTNECGGAKIIDYSDPCENRG